MKLSATKMMKVLVMVFISAIAVIIFGGECQAVSRYYHNYDKCIAESGGRGGIESVAWACRKAAYPDTADSGNSCSLWIGSVSNSVVPEITVYSETGTADIMYWGMCTDFVDTTSRVWVDNDGGAIDDSMNVTRPRQPGVGGRKTTLDVAKFIAVASKQRINECETIYTKAVIVGRQHGTSGSTHQMEQVVKLRVIAGPQCNKGNTCNDWAPASYRSSNAWSGTTSIDVRIKNMAGRFGGVGFGAWNNNDIWAMPTDKIAWITCYYPGVQKTYNTGVGSVNGGDPWLGYDNSPLPTDRCIADRKVTYKKLYLAVHQPWENQYTLSGHADSGELSPNPKKFAIGDSAIKSSIVYKQTVEGDAGKTFTEKAETGKPISASIAPNYPTSNWWAPCHCQGDCKVYNRVWDPASGQYVNGSCREYFYPECYCCDTNNIEGRGNGHPNRYEKTLNDASVNYGPTSDQLSVRLQYNFTVSTNLSVKEDLVYAGERDAITVSDVTTTVGTRYNPVTLANYATQVPNAQIELYAYVHTNGNGGGIGGTIGGSGNICDFLGDEAKQCLKLEEKSRSLNSGGSLGGATDTIWTNLVYNIFDASAGDYMCFASAVSPSNVAGDMDMAGGDGTWIFSEPDCAVIAKRPIYQVWGDSMYSNGPIANRYNKKVQFYKDYKDDVQNKFLQKHGTYTHFFPWVEQSLILNTIDTKSKALTNTIGSGASAGLNHNTIGVGNSGDFCGTMVPLTFSNVCDLGTLFMAGDSGISSLVGNRQELIDYWIGSGTDVGSCGSVWGGDCRRLESANNKNIRYVSGGNLSVGGTIPQNTTYLVKASGTVTISSDLKYNTGAYTHIGAIPKVIIYAANINIACNVNEVDAILITAPGGHTDTCAGGGDINSSARSRQLKIFGTVMTDSITLGRTYGAAANETGSRTDSYGTPSDGAAAEIFDYDSTILMWSEFMSGSGESDTLNTTYQHELAPRY